MSTTYTREPGDDAQSQARWDEDRRVKGWAAPEIWNLGEALGTWLGTALKEFIAVDKPITLRDDEYWDEMAKHADALIAFGDFDDEKRILEKMHPDNIQDIRPELEARTVAAQNALRWVADNLENLWS